MQQRAKPQPEDNGLAPPSDERKEKVLQARISPSLDRELKRRARNLGMSVSTVVRNVLLHTFDLVEDIVSDSTNVALSIAGDESLKSDGHRGSSSDTTVLGWQEAILNLNAICDQCNAILPKGSKATIGFQRTHGAYTTRCSECFAQTISTLE